MLQQVLITIAITILTLGRPVPVESADPITVDGGAPSNPIDVSQSNSFTDTGSTSQNKTVKPALHFSFSGTMTPKTLTIPQLEIGRILKDAAPYLTPSAIGNNTVDFTTPLSITGRSRLCVGDPFTGELKEQASSGIYTSQQIPNLNYTAQYGSFFSAILTRYSITPAYDSALDAFTYDYTLPAYQIGQPPTCQASIESQPEKVTTVQSTGTNTFPNPIVKFFKLILDAFNQPSPDTITVPAEIKIGQVAPYTDRSYCFISGCQQDAVVAPGVDENVRQSGGFANTFVPAVFSAKGTGSPHGEQPSTFTLGGFGSTDVDTKTKTFWTRALQKSEEAITCAITPQSLQTDDCKLPPRQEAFPASNFALDGGTGTSSNPNPTFGLYGTTLARSPDADTSINPYMQKTIEGAAKNAGIPICVLEAVGIIEGAYNWGEKDNYAGGDFASCIPNRCAAAGPFQITVGRDGNGDISCPACGVGYCPDMWRKPLATPCNIPLSAQVAAEKLRDDPEIYDDLPKVSPGNPNGQSVSIESAAYHYYGSRRKESSLTYQGQTLSYPEFVLTRCELYPR